MDSRPEPLAEEDVLLYESSGNMLTMTPSNSSADEEATSPSIKKPKRHSGEARRMRRSVRRRTSTETQGQHACGECPYTTKRRTNLVRHMQAMHSRDKQSECCGHVFNSKSELRRHIRDQHDTGYRCTHCGRLFCRKALLKRHMSVHSGVKEYTCRICSYASSHKSNLERHQRVHYRQPLEAINLQGKKSPRLQEGRNLASLPKMDKKSAKLKAHNHTAKATTQKNQTHNGNTASELNRTKLNPKRMFANPYKCLVCNTRWQSQEALSRHERALHPDLEVKAFLSLPMKRALYLIHVAGISWGTYHNKARLY